ncbi:MAG TPA: FAD-dependent oxidoreductase, partial [Rugosimonospora sp.]|nr:FAD-dependent oxidoreductase [Rugosimonospora sp.]
MTEVVVIGAGIVGAACADQLAGAGVPVTVLERGAIASGTTGAGEGNILVSDKLPGPELDLALLSRELWARLGRELPEAAPEPKGGIVVAMSAAEQTALLDLAAAQRAVGVASEALTPEQARRAEPYLTPELAGAVRYPQDMQ